MCFSVQSVARFWLTSVNLIKQSRVTRPHFMSNFGPLARSHSTMLIRSHESASRDPACSHPPSRPPQVGPFLNHMHPFLQRQLLNYTIFIVEQSSKQWDRVFTCICFICIIWHIPCLLLLQVGADSDIWTQPQNQDQMVTSAFLFSTLIVRSYSLLSYLPYKYSNVW